MSYAQKSRVMLLAVGALAWGALVSAADDHRRFPTDRISPDQWQAYLAEVRALPNVSIRESAQQITIAQEKPTLTLYAFTTPNNPAHPGIVVRRLAATERGYEIKRTGYYAGDAATFERWWRAFDELDTKIKADLAMQSPQTKPVDPSEIQVHRISNGRFRLTLSSQTISSVREAQNALAPKATEVCAGKQPVFDLYRFDKIERVAGPTSRSGDLESFKFEQTIICK